TPCVTTMALTFKGDDIWHSGGLSQPGMAIYLQKDETLDQALDRLTKPGIDWVKKRKFDPYLAKPGKATPGGAYGTSRLPTLDKPNENGGKKGTSKAPAKFG